MGAVAEFPATLDDVLDVHDPDVYPNEVLEGCETALVLFAAKWFGRQDAYWVAKAGLTGTCVDMDMDRLKVMRRIYPDGWEFVCLDVYRLTKPLSGRYALPLEDKYDVVSLDPWTNQFDVCAENIGAWCSLARRAVVLGTGWDTSVTAPEGWRITQLLKRSDYDGGVYWTVLERV